MWSKENKVSFFRMALLGFIFLSASMGYAVAGQIENTKVDMKYPSGVKKKAQYSGSVLFKRCQKMLPKNVDWKDVITTKSSIPKKDIWTNAWNQFAYKQKHKLNQLSGKRSQDLIDFYTKFNTGLDELQGKIARCEAMRSLTKGTDFTDSDATVSGKPSAKKSVDGKIKCVSAGPETQDYKACLKALNIYNGALVGTAVFTQVQTVKFQGDSMESMSGMDPNDPTAGLKAQKDNLEGQAKITGQRAGLDVAKAAGLWATMASIPDHGDLKKRCNTDAKNKISYRPIKDKSKELVKAFYSIDVTDSAQPGNINIHVPNGQGAPNGTPAQQALLNQIQSKKENIEQILSSHNNIKKYCNIALNNAPELLVNQKAREGLKQAMIAAGIDGVKHKLTADQLNKQADQVGGIIDEVNQFNPEELPEFQGQDFQGSECALDPSAEGCDEFVQERSFGFQDTGPLQIHGMENASNFKRGEGPKKANGDNNASTGQTDRSGAPKPIGIIDPKVANKSGFDGRMPGAAEVSRDGPAQASGGGGGGSAAGGGSPPPSQVAQQKQGEQGPRMSDAGNSRVAYDGGGGSLRRSGGRGAMGNNSTDDEEGGNPFADMFGDNDPTQSETLNFRDTASAENQINTPDTSIFEIISDRYVNVQKQDRLLEYKVQGPGELQ